MTRPRRTRRAAAILGSLIAVAALAVVAEAPASGASAGPPTDQHCTVAITGQKKSGEYTLGPVVCGDSTALSVQSIIAVHFVDINFGGASLSITGGTCGGGWLNMPAGWANVVSSTWSVCTTTHYDGYGLSGSSETLFSPGGNLSALQDRTNSVRYT